jgi:hypothetical protein
MVTKLITSFFLLLLLLLLHQPSGTLCKEDDGIAITLHKNEESLHAGLVQEEIGGSNHAKEYERLARMVEATKDRARVLKRGVHRGHGKMSKGKGSAGESLYARSFGGYSVKFSLGTPAQDLLLIMDTGSDLVWVPCTRNYSCINCPEDSASNGVFLPRMSSSLHLVTCADSNCKTLYGNNTELLCQSCAGSLKNCSETCPPYGIQYGRGSTAGLLLTETLNLPLENGEGARAITHFAVGCSIVSSQQPSGIAGFGRGALSMPSQLGEHIGKDRFAYCLQSHRFDEENKKSLMVLGDKALPNNIPLNYTPFLTNSRAPPSSQYGVYYYIGLRGVSIGGKRLKQLPSKLLRFDTKGNGGTIIDSGTTFTVFSDEIFKHIAAGFASQIGYRRAGEVEDKTGMGLCYDVTGLENIVLPEFAFHFKGGSDMVLPVANYFSYFSSFDSICLTMISSRGLLEVDSGPAVILGNDQQQDFYLLYDREKNRLGFTPQTCKTFR